jgi:hypothetical protein
VNVRGAPEMNTLKKGYQSKSDVSIPFTTLVLWSYSLTMWHIDKQWWSGKSKAGHNVSLLTPINHKKVSS